MRDIPKKRAQSHRQETWQTAKKAPPEPGVFFQNLAILESLMWFAALPRVVRSAEWCFSSDLVWRRYVLEQPGKQVQKLFRMSSLFCHVLESSLGFAV